MMVVRLGDRVVGDGAPALVVAEIGINHNGDLQVCKDLIELSAKAGCEVVKPYSQQKTWPALVKAPSEAPMET
jgi:sialic acid synthase SpsE